MNFVCSYQFSLLATIKIFINRYVVSPGVGSIVKVNETVNVSTSNLSGEAIYESVDPKEMLSAKSVAVSATAHTAITLQENPAYAYGMSSEANPKPEDTTDYDDIVMQ